MIGTLQPASSRRFLISGTAAAASGTLTVQRTISEPASASSKVCFRVDSTSAVSVLVMDWTTTGAPPPTVTLPTWTATVLCRDSGAAISAVATMFMRRLLGTGSHICQQGGRNNTGGGINFR